MGQDWGYPKKRSLESDYRQVGGAVRREVARAIVFVETQHTVSGM